MAMAGILFETWARGALVPEYDGTRESFASEGRSGLWQSLARYRDCGVFPSSWGGRERIFELVRTRNIRWCDCVSRLATCDDVDYLVDVIRRPCRLKMARAA